MQAGIIMQEYALTPTFIRRVDTVLWIQAPWSVPPDWSTSVEPNSPRPDTGRSH